MIEEILKSDNDELQVIVFSLGNEEYAIPIKFVQEIITQKTSTRIPKSQPYVIGMINLRGHIVPVVDSRTLFKINTSEEALAKEERVILLDVEEGKIGLIVDKVSEVVNLGTANIEPPPSNIEDNIEFICGVGKYEDRLLILINPVKLLSELDSENMKKFTKVADSIKQAVNLNL